jgi:hypothetical protein
MSWMRKPVGPISPKLGGSCPLYDRHPRRKSHNELGKARPDVAVCVPPDRATELFTYLVRV